MTHTMETIVPRQSVVRVHFLDDGRSFSYYNDQFDLHVGDFVYVEGKLEGVRGRVTEVNYNFKIKLSDYKRVIAVVDTTVHGRFCMAGSHVVTFDRAALPKQQAVTWFKAPAKDDEEFVSGSDDTAFRLDDLKGMNLADVIAERGREYYEDDQVRYLCLDGTKGYAVVEGSDSYEVEFDYENGEIRHLTCSCFCCYNCKHVFAAMLQLRETLERIEKHYADEYAKTGYFAAILKGILFNFAIDGKENGTFVL